MNNLGTITIETERLILRRFKEDDANDVFNNWANDSEVTKHLTWPTHKSIEDTKEYLRIVVNEYEDNRIYHWGIELKEINQVIGDIGGVKYNEDIELVHIGYCMGKKWWNKGIMSEAFSAIIKFLFEEVKVNRIESRYDPRNIYSGKVMERCGLKYEGTMKEADRNNQGVCDTAMYGLVREDYYNEKNKGYKLYEFN